MATRHSSGTARDRRRLGGNLSRTHPSRHGSTRTSANRRSKSEPPAQRLKTTLDKLTGIASQHSPSNRKSKRNRKKRRRSERQLAENVKSPSAPWEVFDDIFNKLGRAADVCTVVVGYLQSTNEDINGRAACASALDDYVDEVIRAQAARIERIYTGKLHPG